MVASENPEVMPEQMESSPAHGLEKIDDVMDDQRSESSEVLQDLPELTGEQIGIIMTKVQDIRTPNVGHHGIEHRFDIGDVLKHGLAPNGKNMASMEMQSEVHTDSVAQAREARSKLTNPYDATGSVDINITGRTSNLISCLHTRNEVGRTRWTSKGNLAVLIDLSEFEEVDPSVASRDLQPMQFKCNTPRQDSWDARSSSLAGKYVYNAHGQITSDEEFGFIIPDGVDPKYFSGIVFDSKVAKTPEEIKREAATRRAHADPKNDEVDYEQVVALEQPYHPGKTEYDVEALRRRAKQIAETMRRAYGDDPHKLLPIYDTRGHLWWPKEMRFARIAKGQHKK